MKKIKYFLMLRDTDPIPKKYGKPSKTFNWTEINEDSLKKLRQEAEFLSNHGDKVKIIREETTISVVKKGDLK